MYNFYSSKDGFQSDEKRERGCGDLEYNTFDNGCYNKESKEDGCNNQKGNEHKEEKSCVIINIYCDNCKKEPKKDDCNNNCKDRCKENSRDNCKDDNKKENDRKEDRSCVIINIYCDRGK